MATDDDQVTLTLQAEFPHEQSFQFPPPYADRAANASGFTYWWKMLNYTLDLPNPHHFPRLTVREPDAARRIKRYITTCEELAQSTVLSHEGGLTIRSEAPDYEVTVVADNPSMEALRGTLTLFRQIHSAGERASFISVSKAIEAGAAREPGPHLDQQREWIKKWRGARARLCAHSLLDLSRRKMLIAKGAPADYIGRERDIRPEVLIRQFQYGDLIHWGDERETLDTLRLTKAEYEMKLFDFISCVIQLSHIYLGFALIASRVDCQT